MYRIERHHYFCRRPGSNSRIGSPLRAGSDVARACPINMGSHIESHDARRCGIVRLRSRRRSRAALHPHSRSTAGPRGGMARGTLAIWHRRRRDTDRQDSPLGKPGLSACMDFWYLCVLWSRLGLAPYRYLHQQRNQRVFLDLATSRGKVRHCKPRVLQRTLKFNSCSCPTKNKWFNPLSSLF